MRFHFPTIALASLLVIGCSDGVSSSCKFVPSCSKKASRIVTLETKWRHHSPMINDGMPLEDVNGGLAGETNNICSAHFRDGIAEMERAKNIVIQSTYNNPNVENGTLKLIYCKVVTN